MTKRESTSKRLQRANQALVRICMRVELYRTSGAVIDARLGQLLTDILKAADTHLDPEVVHEHEDEQKARLQRTGGNP